MNASVATVLAIGILFVGLPILLLVLRDRRRAARRRSAGVDDRLREQRLFDPDWSLVERRLQRPVPPALRTLYDDRALIIRRDLQWSSDYVISAFEPLDAQAMADSAEWLGFDAVAIATTDSGDAIYLVPGAAERDAVYLTHHDGGDTEVFADSVVVMLNRFTASSQ